MSNIFDFGFFKLQFDDEKREAYAYKNLDLTHDYVYEDDHDDEDELDEDDYGCCADCDGWYGDFEDDE